MENPNVPEQNATVEKQGHQNYVITPPIVLQ